MDLFFYGTLLDKDVFEHISGLSLQNIETCVADRQGVRCTGILGQAYPMLVEDQSGSVPGLVFKGIEGQALERIRFYEGYEYDLKEIEVQGIEGVLPVHVFEGSEKPVSDGQPWSLEQWCQSYKAITLRIASTMMPQFDRLSFEDFNAQWDALEAKWGIWESAPERQSA